MSTYLVRGSVALRGSHGMLFVSQRPQGKKFMPAGFAAQRWEAEDPPKRRSSFGKAPRRDTISLRSTHARLYRRARSRRHQRKIARARNLAESISRLRYHHAISRILLRLPQDRAPRLRHYHYPIHAQKRLHRAESAENVSPRLPQPRHLLRKCRQQNFARRRRSRWPGVVRRPRRIYASRRAHHLHLRPLAGDTAAPGAAREVMK